MCMMPPAPPPMPPPPPPPPPLPPPPAPEATTQSVVSAGASPIAGASGPRAAGAGRKGSSKNPLRTDQGADSVATGLNIPV